MRAVLPRRMGLPRPVLRNSNFPCSPGSQSQATRGGTYQQPCARFFPVGWGSLAPSYVTTTSPAARDRSPRLQGWDIPATMRTVLPRRMGLPRPVRVTATSPVARDRSPRLQGGETYQQPCARFFPVVWGSLAPSYVTATSPVARDRSPRLQGLGHTNNHARGSSP
jgi:hypothetical protein